MSSTIFGFEIEQNREDLNAFVSTQKRMRNNKKQAVKVITEFQEMLESGKIHSLERIYKELCDAFAGIYGVRYEKLNFHTSADLDEKYYHSEFYDLMGWNLDALRDAVAEGVEIK